MRVEALWVLTVREGSRVRRRRIRARSFVRAYLAWLASHLEATNYSTPDTTNTLRSILLVAAHAADGAADVDTKGIVAGTGTNAVAGTDYALQTLIAKGTGAGQLDYGAEASSAPAVTASQVSFAHTRTLSNLSGGSITIQEVALYVIPAGQAYSLCFERSRVAGGFAVANGATVTIEYTFKVTY